MSGDRFFVETWGCQMNELDSQRMSGLLMAQSMLPTREVLEANVILLNSCSVREKAQQKSYSRLGEYRRLIQEFGITVLTDIPRDWAIRIAELEMEREEDLL